MEVLALFLGTSMPKCLNCGNSGHDDGGNRAVVLKHSFREESKMTATLC